MAEKKTKKKVKKEISKINKDIPYTTRQRITQEENKDGNI